MPSNGVVASDKQSRDQENGLVTREQRLEMYSGPLPHPGILRQYQEIVPDAPERILRMAEKQSEHRLEIEKRVVKGSMINERLGLAAGFIVCMSALFLGTKILLSGHEVYGFAAIVTALASLVGFNIYAKRSKERKSKKQEE
jgi:uncharacterized membrane protein